MVMHKQTSDAEARKLGYLAIIPDEVEMTREYFASLVKRYRYCRDVSYGFSEKHTADIMAYRKKTGSKASDCLYAVPVQWNTKVTYVK